MTRRVRWTCLSEVGCAAVLGSTRPRRDDVVRYCLACSERTGRLVKRVAPVLEEGRAARHVKRTAKTKVQVEKARETRERYYTVDGVNLLRELEVMWRLPVAKEWQERRRFMRDRGKRPELPTLKIRRQQVIKSQLGVAYLGTRSITVAVTANEKAGRALATLCHEVTHILVGQDQAGGYHGSKFKATLRTLREEYQAVCDRELGGDRRVPTRPPIVLEPEIVIVDESVTDAEVESHEG